MSEELKARIRSWFTTNNGHPCDDNSFYDIVLDTQSNKITPEEWRDTLVESGAMVSEDAITSVINRYEDLYNFLIHYQSVH